MRVNIRLSTQGRNALLKLDQFVNVKIPDMAKMVTLNTSSKMANEAKRIVEVESRFHGKKPGQLAKSITYTPQMVTKRRRSYLISAEAPYAGFVEYGTKPHDIWMPVNSEGDKMASGWRGNHPKRRYSGRVHHFHPGGKAMNFMSRAMDYAEQELVKLAVSEVDKAMNILR